MLPDHYKAHKPGEFFLCEDTASVLVRIPGGALTCFSATGPNGLERAKEYLEKAIAHNKEFNKANG